MTLYQKDAGGGRGAVGGASPGGAGPVRPTAVHPLLSPVRFYTIFQLPTPAYLRPRERASMRPFILCLSLISLTNVGQANAQTGGTTPAHVWSLRGGGPSGDEAKCVAFDSDGNVIIAGRGYEDVDLGGGVLPDGSVFLAKYDSGGGHLWSHTYGGAGVPGSADIRGLVVDDVGDIVITGQVDGSMDFEGEPVVAVGIDGDPFIAKFNASGVHQWSRRSEVTNGYGFAVAVGGGFIYLAGSHRVQINHYMVLVEKYDAGGALQWRKTFDDGYDAGGSGIAVDGSGNIVVIGDFSGHFTFPGGYIETGCWDLGFKCGDRRDALFLALDSEGEYRWHRQGNGPKFDTGNDLAMDASGNVYGMGWFEEAITLGGAPVQSDYGTYLVKYSPSGEYHWAAAADYFTGFSGGVAVDGNGHVWLTTGSDLFLAKYNANNGALIWSHDFGGDGVGNEIAADGSGNIAFAGWFRSTVSLGGDPLSSAGSLDVFLAKYADNLLPVLITRFEAQPRHGEIDVQWDLWTDEGLDHLALYRSDDLNVQWKLIDEIDPAVRSYVDARVEPGRTYTYQLSIHTSDGDEIRSQPATVSMPRLSTAISHNLPNPFSVTTTIEFTLGEPADVQVGIYDVSGRLVTRLGGGRRDAGTYYVDWNGLDARGHATGSGVYFYRLEGVRQSPVRKMILVR